MTDLDKMARGLFLAWLPASFSRETHIDDDGEEQYSDEWVQGAWSGFSAALLTAPPGWKLVPAVPTCEMLAAGERGHWQKQSDMLHPTPTEFPDACGGPMGYAYAAMLDAAPEPKCADSK